MLKYSLEIILQYVSKNSFSNSLWCIKNTLIIWVYAFTSCGNAQQKNANEQFKFNESLAITTAAQRIDQWISKIKNKKIGVVGNQTSILYNDKMQLIHLVDTIIAKNIQIKAVFAPEHGFRGIADAGEHIENGIDTSTGLPIISLYGKNKKPSTKQLEDIDVLLFDIQDVGVRFYTYISTLHYIMKACAENNIPLIVLDRPNPNCHYIDGPILTPDCKSFVGMHPVPVVYGMTIGEYAQMINGENWLEDGLKCDLEVIPLKNYHHKKSYKLPVNPSPNLPNETAINLYPSLCFFEGTKNVSVGRGTNMQFQVYGQPMVNSSFCFTPQPNKGAKYPKNVNISSCGEDLRNYKFLSNLELKWLIKAYEQSLEKKMFFNNFFDKLSGNKKLRQQIINGMSTESIKESWFDDLKSFKMIRNKYLIYPK